MVTKLNTGSIPLEVSAKIEIVPVGATIVTAQFRIGWPLAG